MNIHSHLLEETFLKILFYIVGCIIDKSKIIDFGTSDNIDYFILEHLSGDSLENAVPVPWLRDYLYLRSIIKTMDYDSYWRET